MSMNYLVNVPKLKGRENYSEWCFAAENFLILEGMKHCVKPEVGENIEAADDVKTKAKLIMTIDPSLYVHIKNVTTSALLWEKLKNLFDDSGFSRRITLLRNLISIRQENCSSMTAYVTQIIDTAQKLSGTGFQINEEWIGSLLLAGLPERFTPMIMAIEHSGISITSDSIKTKLMDMEMAETSEVNSAFAVNQKHARRKNLSMHEKVGSTDQLSMSNSKSDRKVKCYRCKQPGHYKNQCTNSENSSNNSKNKNRMHSNAFSAVFLSGNFNKSEWYIDSGASVHLTANESWIRNACYNQKQEIIVANDEKVSVLCSGDVQITTTTESSDYDIIVENVLCIPTLTTNLLSVSQLIEKGNAVSFTDTGCTVYNKKNVLVATATLTNGVYRVNLCREEQLVAAVTGVEWHRRLGHINKEYLNQMPNAVDGMSISEKVDIGKSSCITCCEAKQCRLPFISSRQRSNELLDIVHTDVCGPMENVSIGGSRYFLLFVDDHSRMAFVYFMKNKNEALKWFKQFKNMVENQTKKTIKVLRSDNGLEYCNQEFDEHLNKAGIIHQKTNPYTPQQNGLCERYNRTIVEKARCLLFDAKLSTEFWGEATNTAVYLQNRTVAAALDGKTPYEVWHGTKPDVSHLRIFGSIVMVHIAKEKRKKWDKKSEKCILLGYPEDVKGYRIYNPEKKTISTSRDVIILEQKPSSECQILVQEKRFDSVGEDKQELSQTEDMDESKLNQDHSFLFADETQYDPNDVTYVPSDYEDAGSSSEDVIQKEPVRSRPSRIRRKPDKYGLATTCVPGDSMDNGEITLEEALSGPEKSQWLEAVRDELQCFEDNNAWELVDAPKGGTVVQCKWVLRKKYDSENNVRYRARLVAKGFTQKHGVDYTETFSPVVRHTTLRLLFALSVQLDLEVTHLDVKTAFLNGDLEETIFMKKPDLYSSLGSVNKVLKLNKAIYGLKQASRAWNKKVDTCLLNNGYEKSKIEPCMYIKNENKCKTIVTVYVDDFFIFSNDKSETCNIKRILSNQFKIKDLGEVKQCIGMNVSFNRKEGSVTLSQETYINQLLNKFNLTDCKTVVTPMETKLNLDKGQSVNCNIPYQQLMGSLMYLSVLTRPDITYSVSYLSQFNNCYTDVHWGYAKRVLKYLKQTKSFGISYSKAGNSLISGFVDADWASDTLDRRSYTGYCFVLSNGVISWESRKQKTIALSSTEAEYMGITEACREALYLKRLQYEVTGNNYTLNLLNDNQSALKLPTNPVYHKRSKHIDVRYHFCRECVLNKVIKIEYMPTADMPADLLTKSLCSNKHYKFMNCLGLTNV